MNGCLACDLTEGRLELPGGRIHATAHWVVEHCIGPLGVGTLIVKPLRHCLHISELRDDESSELGPLLRRVTSVIQELVQAEQVYVCLWSFAGWEAGHIHFVVQPAWGAQRETYEHPGPCLQRDMLHTNEPLPRDEVEAFCAQARAALQTLEAPA